VEKVVGSLVTIKNKYTNWNWFSLNLFLDFAKKMENYKGQFKNEMERIQKHGTKSVYSFWLQLDLTNSYFV
jgi:hypothetical protein